MDNDKPTMNELLAQFAPEYMAGKPANQTTPSKPIGFAAYTEGEAKALVDSHKNALLASQVNPLVDALDDAYGEICGLECDGTISLLKTRIEKALQDVKQCLEAVE